MSYTKPLLCCLLILLMMSSCKKDKATAPEEEIISPITGTRLEFSLDSIFLYARQVYLWSDALPSYPIFNPRQYASASSEFTALSNDLFAISQLKKNPATASPYESPVVAGHAKYSFIQRGTSAGLLAATATAAENPVYVASLINQNGVKIPYIALGSFPLLNNCKSELDEAFGSFSSADPAYIIIDLRTNGGGYVETAEYIANLLANPSLNGKTMYVEQYNTLMQSGKATILKHQPYLDGNGKPVQYNGRNATMADVDYSEAGNTYRFSKKGSLNNLTAVYFIVSGQTASASELLISCLKPYLTVKLVGSRTYGKPVGFFPIQIDRYSVYFSSFIIKNAQGWSDYFAGIPVDITVTAQSYPVLGDPEEACLKAVLASISGNTGTVSLQNKQSAVRSSDSAPETLISDTSPSLMIENRLRLKAQ